MRKLVLVFIGLYASLFATAQTADFEIHWENNKSVLVAQLPKTVLKDIFFEEGCNYHLTIASCVKAYVQENIICKADGETVEMNFMSIDSDQNLPYVEARFMLFNVDATLSTLEIEMNGFTTYYPNFQGHVKVILPDTIERIVLDSAKLNHTFRF